MKISRLLPLLLLATGLAHAESKPFSQDEISVAFRAMTFGLTQVYLKEPESARLEGCVDFELRILIDGTTPYFRRTGGAEASKATLKTVEKFVVNRFSLLRDRIEHPQPATHTICFHKDSIEKPVLTEKPAAEKAPLNIIDGKKPASSELEEKLNDQKGGVTNDEWLQKLMRAERGEPEPETPVAESAGKTADTAKADPQAPAKQP